MEIIIAVIGRKRGRMSFISRYDLESDIKVFLQDHKISELLEIVTEMVENKEREKESEEK